MDTSPIQGLSKGLAFMSIIGGFPSKISEDGYNVRHTFWGWARLMVVVLAFFPLICFTAYMFTLADTNMLEVGPALKEHMSMTDALCVFGLCSINLTMTYLTLLSFFYGVNDMSTLFRKFKPLRRIPLSKKEISKVSSRVTAYVVFLLSLNAVLTGINTVGGVRALSTLKPDATAIWTYMHCFWFYVCFLSYFSPLSASGYMSSTYILAMMKYREFMSEKYPSLRKLIELEEDSREESKEGKVFSLRPSAKSTKVASAGEEGKCPAPFAMSSLEDDLRLGIAIQDLIKNADKFFGSFFTVECGVDLITESVAAYLSFLIPEAFTSEAGHDFSTDVTFQVKLWMGLSHALLAMLAMLRHFGVTYRGHKVASGNEEIREVLKKHFLESRQSILSDSERTLLDVLMDETSSSSPVRPLNLFDLNLSTLLSGLGLCLTYVIVLLQFRMGESSSGSDSSHNPETEDATESLLNATTSSSV